MMNSRSFVSLLITAMVFACVASCDEQDEKFEARSSSLPSRDVKKGALRTEEVSFNSAVGDPLDLATAKRWTENFRQRMSKADEIRSHYFGNEIIQGILSQSGCVGIRIYYALDDNGDKKLLVVGVDSSGKDLLPADGARVEDEGNTIADYSLPCPTLCGQDL